MSTATLLLAFSAGMVAAVNPCGFALLPAYLAYYLGLESSGDAAAPPRGGELGRSLAVSGAMTRFLRPTVEETAGEAAGFVGILITSVVI